MVDCPRLVNFTPVVDTAAYANSDLLFDTTEVPYLAFNKNQAFVLDQVTIFDKSDNTGLIMDLYLLDVLSSLGSINGAPNINDTNALNIMATMAFATADWKDLGGIKVASKNNLGLIVKPATDSQSVYAAGVLGAVTPTFGAASDLVIRFGCSRW